MGMGSCYNLYMIRGLSSDGANNGLCLKYLSNDLIVHERSLVIPSCIVANVVPLSTVYKTGSSLLDSVSQMSRIYPRTDLHCTCLNITSLANV